MRSRTHTHTQNLFSTNFLVEPTNINFNGNCDSIECACLPQRYENVFVLLIYKICPFNIYILSTVDHLNSIFPLISYCRHSNRCIGSLRVYSRRNAVETESAQRRIFKWTRKMRRRISAEFCLSLKSTVGWPQLAKFTIRSHSRWSKRIKNTGSQAMLFRLIKFLYVYVWERDGCDSFRRTRTDNKRTERSEEWEKQKIWSRLNQQRDFKTTSDGL